MWSARDCPARKCPAREWPARKWPAREWSARECDAKEGLPGSGLPVRRCQAKYKTAFDDFTTVQGTFMNYNSPFDCVDL